MKINICYLKTMYAADDEIKFYKKKYGYNDFELLKAYKKASNNWQARWLGVFDIEKIEYLIKNKANINIQADYGDTPLHWGCRTNNFESVKLLINYGANINIKNENDSTILHYIAYLPIDLLLRVKPIETINLTYGRNMYERHLMKNDINIINLLFKKGININEKDNDDKTPLYYALLSENLEKIKLFLEIKNIKDNEFYEILNKFEIKE